MANHNICSGWFRGPLTPPQYLARFPRYSASYISGSWPWPFMVTLCHRSRGHKTRRGWFPIGGPLTPTIYLASLLSRMRHLSDKHIPSVTALVTILRSFGGTLAVMPFFGKAPLAAAEGVVWGISHHNRSTRVDTAVFRPSHWKCIRISEIWAKLG